MNTNTANKLTAIAQNQQKVYDAGYSKGESDFWNAMQDNGKRRNYENAFQFWGCEYIRPMHKVKTSADYRLMSTFKYNLSLKKVEAKYFDFSDHQVNSGTGYTFDSTFAYCNALEEIEDIGFKNGNYSGTFTNCFNLHTIAVLRVAETDTFSKAYTFKECYNLQNVTIEGTIGQNGFDVRWSTKLTHGSLMSIINALADYHGDGLIHTVTLGEANLAKLTDAEKAIATERGWTLA